MRVYRVRTLQSLNQRCSRSLVGRSVFDVVQYELENSTRCKNPQQFQQFPIPSVAECCSMEMTIIFDLAARFISSSTFDKQRA